MEEEFCSINHPQQRCNEDTEKLASRMGSILNKFREVALPIYLIRYPDADKMNIIDDTFHKFSPAPSDKIINKSDSSAFHGSTIINDLRENGIKNLLLCGVNRSECVYKTAIDGIKDKFNIFLLDDLTCDGKGFKRKNETEAEETMDKKGVIKIKSDNLIQDIKSAIAQPKS